MCGVVLVAVCLARCLLNEGARRSSEKQAITPARYDEGTNATNHNAATGERDTIAKTYSRSYRSYPGQPCLQVLDYS